MGNNSTEKSKAIQLGKVALEKLEELLDCIESAKKWGTLDVFSKDLLPTLVKRSKLKKSEVLADDVRIAVEDFRNSLVDSDIVRFNLEKIVDKTKKIDYFLGNIGNMLVQSKIKANLIETKKVYSVIKECVRELESVE